MDHTALLVTIDGPAGAGKTTVSKMLAGRLGYRYLDTGALYRAVAVAAQRDGVAADDDRGLTGLCAALALRLDGERVFLSGQDVTDRLRTPEISLLASAVSARPVVRQTLFGIQRAIGQAGGVVAEGRDMGTVVFPEADVKFFLDASVRQRALRRFAQYGDGGPSLETIEQDIRRRDANDSHRDLAPLKPAADALIIDSSRISAADVVDRMMSRILPLIDGDTTGSGPRPD